MSAPSLYRRHRPRTFDDVVGQDHVVRTLRNAVEQGKVHHAYLFVGSRGTGKTSMAKILASCLDCEHGPTPDPCGKCDSCLSIQRATSLDVVEMDAASNNSVDDMRELRERVQTAPTMGGWRVYILDEAHMLTTQAWNALLKTLEEPPPQTVFVLATTEAHKVLPTVVDRCHRFDFTRPTGEQISRVLGRVADREGLQLDEGARALVARNASGSFRDALGTLEQLVTYAGNSVTEEDAVTVLGIGDDAQLFGAVEAVIAGDAGAALRVVQDVASHGRDLGSYSRELERHARDLLVCCILGSVPAEVRLTADRDARLEDQARRTGRDQATRLLELLATSLTATRDGADERAMLELALVKAADPAIDPALRALQVRLARLEQGGVPAPAPSAPSQPAAAAPAQSAPAQSAPPTPAPAPAPPAASAPPTQSTPPVPTRVPEPTPPAHREPTVPTAVPSPAPAEPGEPYPDVVTPQQLQAHPATPTPAGGFPPSAPVDLPAEPHVVPDFPTIVPRTPDSGSELRHAPEQPDQQNGSPLRPVPTEQAPSVDLDAPPVVSGITVADIATMWPAVLDNVRERDTLCAVALERARPVEFTGDALTVAFPTDAAFYRGTADREERRAALRDALREVTGQAPAIHFELRDLTGPAEGEEGGLPAVPSVAAPAVLDESAIVAHLMTEFDAEDLGENPQEPA